MKYYIIYPEPVDDGVSSDCIGHHDNILAAELFASKLLNYSKGCIVLNSYEFFDYVKKNNLEVNCD